MNTFSYTKLEEGDLERLADDFCQRHGDRSNGIIPDDEYDRLFDLSAEVLQKYGSFTEGSEDADFSGYRYVDQVPWITIVAEDSVKPNIAVRAGLEAVSRAHRPFALAFDYNAHELVIMPGAKVFSTFEETELK